MSETYPSEVLARIAKTTAHQVGWEAVTWWQDRGDPRFLHIEAAPQDFTVAEPPTVTLQAFLLEVP